MSLEPATAFIYTPRYLEFDYGPGHPLRNRRLELTYDLISACGLLALPSARCLAPEPATDDDLLLFVQPDYLTMLKAADAGQASATAFRYGLGAGDNPIVPGIYRWSALVAGPSPLATRLVESGEVGRAFNISGGLHHAGPAKASGFCYINDAALIIADLCRRGHRVAYVDIDVHHGDGVQWAFYDTDRALTISLHQDGRTLFPGTGFINETGRGAGEGFSVNLPLPPQTDDESYLWAFEQVVPPLLERFQPDVVVTQLGVDTHFQDPLANLALTTHGHEALFRAFDRLAPKWLALGGGGYALDVVPRSWALAFGVMSGQTLPEELPPSYRARYGGQWLHDHERPEIDPLIRRHVRSVVEERVARVKSLFQIP